MDPVEIVGVVFGVLSVYLVARESVWGWPLGLVNVGAFAFVFYRARLYGDAGLQIVYFALAFYGWWSWLHGGDNRGELRVARAPQRALVALAAAAAGFALLLGTALARTTDAFLPFVDAGTTSFSLMAQLLQTRKWIESWWVWIAVDVVLVAKYLAADLPLTAGLYVLFLALCMLGLRQWRRSLDAGSGAAVPA